MYKASPLLMFHAAPKLTEIKEKEKQKDNPDQSLINDIGTALRFVEEDFGAEIANLQSLLSAGQITFELLWTLFPPQEPIIAMSHGVMRQPQAFPVISSDYGVRENHQRYFYAYGKVITHDGQDFGKASLTVTTDAFEGARDITTLDFYPLSYHPDEAGLRARLVARGKKYMALLQEPSCRDYPVHYATWMSEYAMQQQNKEPEKIDVRFLVLTKLSVC